MDEEFYRQQALRVRDLAGKVDPFTKRRLLDLAAKYDAEGGVLHGPHGPSNGRCRSHWRTRCPATDSPERHEKATAHRVRV
jgi:hypothetical protein